MEAKAHPVSKKEKRVVVINITHLISNRMCEKAVQNYAKTAYLPNVLLIFSAFPQVTYG